MSGSSSCFKSEGLGSSQQAGRNDSVACHRGGWNQGLLNAAQTLGGMDTIMASKELEELLSRFSTAVDRTELSPKDHRRFRDVIRVAGSDPTFSAQALKARLAGDGWPDAAVEALVWRFEDGRKLLAGQ